MLPKEKQTIKEQEQKIFNLELIDREYGDYYITYLFNSKEELIKAKKLIEKYNENHYDGYNINNLTNYLKHNDIKFIEIENDIMRI